MPSGKYMPLIGQLAIFTFVPVFVASNPLPKTLLSLNPKGLMSVIVLVVKFTYAKALFS